MKKKVQKITKKIAGKGGEMKIKWQSYKKI